MSLLSYSTRGHVALIQLNRPEAMNAMNMALRAELMSAMDQAEANETIRVVVLTGSGRAFSSGTDLKEGLTGEKDFGRFDNSVRDYKPIVDRVANSDKIYIAAINGFAGGVALGLAFSADLAVMADDATLFSPFTAIGLVPDGGASWWMLHHLGYKRAFEAIAEGTRLSASDCLEAGMVNRVVSAETLVDDAMAWAETLAQRAPLALRYTKKILREAMVSSPAQTARAESEYQMMAVNSEDSQEGIGAFIGKRQPVWKGR